MLYVVTSWSDTRSAPTADGHGFEHDHGSMAVMTGSGAAQPVTLSASEAQRIGVTYAVAEVGPLRRDVRTVGQVTFDEARIHTIAPKIDGWVEQLVVNSTGQLVVAGQPLLTIYSPMLVSAQEELLLARQLETDVAGATGETRQRTSDLLASARRRLAYWDIPDSVISDIERRGVVRKTMTIRASSGGYVLEKNVLAGQKIMNGDALFKVADLSTVWIEGEVFEQDLASVHVGAEVRSEFQALPGGYSHRSHLVRLSHAQPQYAHGPRAGCPVKSRYTAQARDVCDSAHQRRAAERGTDCSSLGGAVHR